MKRVNITNAEGYSWNLVSFEKLFQRISSLIPAFKIMLHVWFHSHSLILFSPVLKWQAMKAADAAVCIAYSKLSIVS